MEKLSRGEVLHVARLSRLDLTEEEIDKYSYQLKELMDSIDRIKDIDVTSDDIMISPWSIDNVLSSDTSEPLSCEEVLLNAPVKSGSYIEVRGVFND